MYNTYDGKRLSLPLDTRNTRAVTSALPPRGGWGEDVGSGWDMDLRYPYLLDETAQALFHIGFLRGRDITHAEVLFSRGSISKKTI